MLTISNIFYSRLVIGCFRPAKTELNLWLAPVPASLFLEDVVNLLKRLFALNVAQDISSLEKDGSILLELNRNFGELPSTLKFGHEVAHVVKQGFENIRLPILFDSRKYLCLQFVPVWRWTPRLVDSLASWITRVSSMLVVVIRACLLTRAISMLVVAIRA